MNNNLKLNIPAAALNLGVFAVLSAIITFAVVMFVDVIISALGGGSIGFGAIFCYACSTFIGGLVTGVLYVPAAYTVNEKLFRYAAVSVIVAITLSQIVAIGANWALFTVMTAMVCLAAACFVVPNRVSTAYEQRDSSVIANGSRVIGKRKHKRVQAVSNDTVQQPVYQEPQPQQYVNPTSDTEKFPRVKGVNSEYTYDLRQGL